MHEVACSGANHLSRAPQPAALLSPIYDKAPGIRMK